MTTSDRPSDGPIADRRLVRRRRWPVVVVAGIAALGLAPSAVCAAAGAWSTNEHGAVRLVAAERVAAPGAALDLGVEFRTAPGWHVYWKNPGDAGFPPRLELLAPPALRGVALLFPRPTRFDLSGGLVAFGYEGEVIYPLAPRALGPATAPDGSVRIEADVDYLTCEVDCVPYRATLALDLPLGRSEVDDSEIAPRLARFVAQVPRRAFAGVEAALRLEPDPLAPERVVVEVRGARPTDASGLFVEPQDLFEIGRPVVRAVSGGAVFSAPLARRRTDRPLPERYGLALAVVGLEKDGRAVDLEMGPEFGRPEPDAGPAERPAVAALAASGLASLATFLAAVALGCWSGGRNREGAPLPLGRGLAGFGAAGGSVVALGLLAGRVAPVGIALVELALLGLGLALWLAGRAAREVGPRWRVHLALALALAAAVAAPAIAHRYRFVPEPAAGRLAPNAPASAPHSTDRIDGPPTGETP